jgi:hypothetical protein
VFDIVPLLEEICRNKLTMALGCMFLRTHQAEGRAELSQAFGQYISSVIPQLPIALAPIRTVHKEVPQFYR